MGLLGILLWRKNLVLIILSLEISFISSNIGFVLSSLYLDDVFGYIFSLISLTIAGSEVSLGLALAILLYRKLDTIFIRGLNKLKS
jgi:NADH-quinone oxidoreductase subunit K